MRRLLTFNNITLVGAWIILIALMGFRGALTWLIVWGMICVFLGGLGVGRYLPHDRNK